MPSATGTVKLELCFLCPNSGVFLGKQTERNAESKIFNVLFLFLFLLYKIAMHFMLDEMPRLNEDRSSFITW